MLVQFSAFEARGAHAGPRKVFLRRQLIEFKLLLSLGPYLRASDNVIWWKVTRQNRVAASCCTPFCFKTPTRENPLGFIKIALDNSLAVCSVQKEALTRVLMAHNN